MSDTTTDLEVRRITAYEKSAARLRARADHLENQQ